VRIFAFMAVLALLVGLGAWNVSVAQPQPLKLALVIGNADYDANGRVDFAEAAIAASEANGFVPDLRNPPNDAADIRDALQAIGFKVKFLTNADAQTLRTALATFGAELASASDDAQVIIYYAGHAVQLDGANFLIPVGAKLPALDFSRMPSKQAQTILAGVAVPTGEVLDQFQGPAAPGLNLLILDSCRNNPWERRMRGLTRGPSQTRRMADLRANIARTIVAFATQPGDVAQDGIGRNSPYSGALKTKLVEPGTVLQILDLVGEAVQTATQGRQTPWFQCASVGRMCLFKCPETFEAALQDRCAVADSIWRSVSASSDPEVLKGFATSHADCPSLAVLATSRSRELQRGQEKALRDAEELNAYQSAVRSRSRVGYSSFVEKFPDSTHLEDVKRRLASCRRVDVSTGASVEADKTINVRKSLSPWGSWSSPMEQGFLCPVAWEKLQDVAERECKKIKGTFSSLDEGDEDWNDFTAVCVVDGVAHCSVRESETRSEERCD
jgi:hypothetical protein